VSKFHQSRAWTKLAKDHKTIRCIDCKKDTDIQSSHYLPQERFKMSRLWKWGLYYGCKDCNGKLGDKIKWSFRAIQLLMVYGTMKGIYWGMIIIYFALTTTVMYKDLSIGGLEVSITGQVLIESWERVQQLWGML